LHNIPRDERTINGPRAKMHGVSGVTLDDFVAVMPMHNYVFMPTREAWPPESVDARLPPVGKLSASKWLDANQAVEQLTWAPGKPPIIKGQLIAEGGWITRPGCSTLNLYRPPTIEQRSGDVSRWLNHIKKLYGSNADHIIKYLAHRVQHPHEKINHALVLGGDQGIGKDTLLAPIPHAVGPWNCQEVSPRQVMGRFNGFLKSVFLRISEARDLGDVDRYAFYDHLKAYVAAPPDVLRVDEKNLREHPVVNVCGVVITTNHKTNGIFLPADDRRHFVAWSTLTKDDFDEAYWKEMWAWFDDGGYEAITHYLATLELAGFNPKAPPPKTEAFWEIVNANRSNEDAEMADVIDTINASSIHDAITLVMLENATADSGFKNWLMDRKNARQIPHRLEACGYVPVRNSGAVDGLWKINDKRKVIYARRELDDNQRLAAASKLIKA
jgi:hypothetical protein